MLTSRSFETRLAPILVVRRTIRSSPRVIAAIATVWIRHESQKAVHYEIDWDQETRTQIGEIDLSSFDQLEGVAIIGNEQLHFFGEDANPTTKSKALTTDAITQRLSQRRRRHRRGASAGASASVSDGWRHCSSG